MAGSIGIKIANGDFYPIIEENSTEKKRLVLTTVHDEQASVQIDLFRSITRSMLDAQYIGSLIVENIKPRPRGEPSIAMTISSSEDGSISSEAGDIDASEGEHSVLNISLKTLDTESSPDNFPDFDLESEVQTPSRLYEPVETVREEKRKLPWFIMACATVFVIVVIALLWFFFLGGKEILPFAGKGQEQSAPVLVAPPAPDPVEPPLPPPPPPEPEPLAPPPVVVVEEVPAPVVEVIPEEPAPVEPAEPVLIQAPAAPPPARTVKVDRTRPPAPVASYKVPAVIPRNGVAYRIRWGDTLWDISDAFYRNPWLYHRIARFNHISNPDLIISGRTIRIPPRN